ncbi:MAG: PQQ-binding-like beta-propeller repeat protein [Armatimonadota bacterium]
MQYPFTTPLLRAALASTLIALPALAGTAPDWVAPAEPGVEYTSVASDRRGNAFVAGREVRAGGASALYVASFDASGARRWSARVEGGTFTTPAGAAAVETDSSGDLYVTGAASAEGGAPGFAVLKYSGATGRLLWQTAVTPLANGGATAGGLGTSLALSGSRTVVAAGYVVRNDAPYGAVAALDSRSGKLRWEWLSGSGEIRGVATDRRGDVAVTGVRLLAAKLNGKNGRERWRVEQTSPRTAALGAPVIRTVAMDRSGNVTVGGSLRKPYEDSLAFYVAQLQSKNGKIRWEFSGPAQPSFETPAEVAVSSNGQVYACGRYESSPVSMQLRASNGRVTWLRRPWEDDARADISVAVTDLAVDKKHVYLCGSDASQVFRVVVLSSAGRELLRVDLGRGEARALAPAPNGRLFVVGSVLDPDTGAMQAALVRVSVPAASAGRRR